MAQAFKPRSVLALARARQFNSYLCREMKLFALKKLFVQKYHKFKISHKKLVGCNTNISLFCFCFNKVNKSIFVAHVGWSHCRPQDEKYFEQKVEKREKRLWSKFSQRKPIILKPNMKDLEKIVLGLVKNIFTESLQF